MATGKHRGRALVARAGVLIGTTVLSLLLLSACKNKTAPAPTLNPQAAQSTAPTAEIVQTSTSPVDAVKLAVDQVGLYRVAGAELAAAGFDPSRHDPAQLRLTLNDQPVTLAVEGSGADLDLTFYGQPRASRYGRENVYWLRWDDAPQQAQGRQVTAIDGEALVSFPASVRLEESTQYLSQIPADTGHWLWQSLFAPAAYTTTFDLPGWAGGDVALSMAVWSNTEDAAKNPDHHAQVRINGQTVADQSWDGKMLYVITTTVSADAVRPAGNELTLDAPGDTGATVDVIYLDRVELSYARSFVAQQGRLAFEAPAGSPVWVTGLDAASALLWDVTDSTHAQPLSGAQAGNEGLRFQDGAGDAGQRRYVVVERSARLSPLSIRPVHGVDLRQNAAGADYIAVVYPDFIDALQPLVELRRSQGLRMVVASIDDVYDTWSSGMPDPEAIRSFMRHARDHWPKPAPRFLLLVGDASYDYQGFVAGGTPNYVPTYLLETHFVGETASDNWFVSLDDEDDLPDMAVGRIPASSAEQVADVVAKTLAYEQDQKPEAWASRALFVADDKQTDFQQISDRLAAESLPASYQIEKIYLGQSDHPNAAVLDAIDNGVGLITYVGHGSMNVWAQEKILSIDDAGKLRNDALPFMMTMSCLVGYFHHPQASSMGEELLFNPRGGVAAALVPTSESLASDQSQLASAVYNHLFGDAATIGEAIMLGKRDLKVEDTMMQDLIETFTLLGDPALRLHRPG